MRLDEQDVMTKKLSTRLYRMIMFLIAGASTAMIGRRAVGGIAARSSYAQVSCEFGSLESFADSCNNDEAAFYLYKSKSRMLFVKCS